MNTHPSKPIPNDAKNLVAALTRALGLARQGEAARAEGILRAHGYVKVEDCATHQLPKPQRN